VIKELKKEAQGLSVLFVEDDANFLGIIKEMLDMFFGRVEVATDGEEGLLKYNQNGPFDIVITDITMPKMDGLAMSENIKTNNPSQHILAVSAHSDVDKLIRAIDIGIDSFLLKPVDSMVFLGKLLKISKSVNVAAIEEREKELEKLLITQSKMAAMGEMISIISHQLKQPLNAMNIMASNIDGRALELLGKEDPELSNSTKLIRQQVAFMASTIDTFADFLKPSKAEKKFSLKECVGEVLTILSARLKSRYVTVDERVSADVTIFGYKKEFNQALLNIISNAIDAFADDSKNRQIVICTEQKDKDVVLSIDDNAGGIFAQIIDRIFEPYITSKGESGTGLGLHITKKIIEEHFDGHIRVENTDTGARFVIELKGV
jgi:signal transduction histidine kinase